MAKQYTKIKNKYLASAMSFLGFHYYIFNDTDGTKYFVFENTDKFSKALTYINNYKKEIND